MSEVFESSAFAGVLLSLSFYWLGCLLKKKLKLAIVNPLLIAIAGTIAFLLIFGVDYDTYYSGNAYYIKHLIEIGEESAFVFVKIVFCGP